MNRTHYYIYITAMLLLLGAATTSHAQTLRGKIYGGGQLALVDGNTKVEVYTGTVGDGTAFDGGVFGGGLGQQTVVTQNVEVIIGKEGADRNATGATINGDVYGGSALGNTNCSAELAPTENAKTDVTLNAGVINGSMYGGALGQKNGVNDATSDIAANVYGPVQVTQNGGNVWNTDNTGRNGSGGIYGCNNLNGEPKNTVKVDIYRTNSHNDNETADDYTDDKYAVFAVYGGGNQASYSTGTPEVKVHGCENSIEYIYGGGNAAHLTHKSDDGNGNMVGDGKTDVTIYGCELINNVFGGGNGQVQAANVSGSTNVEIYGGKILNVYGGSNTNGMIGGSANVSVLAQGEGGGDACGMDITNVYGGGNRAAGKAGTVTIACTGNGTIENVYGGANMADLTGDITLNITGGQIKNVFGGNNNSGNIDGAITVNVDWATDDGSCGTNSLTNVYGGGNLAQYYAYGYEADADGNHILDGEGNWTMKAIDSKKTYGPTVNIKNAHITGSVFGAGKGDENDTTHERGMVIGHPTVFVGSTTGGTVMIDGNVFGGGDAANVNGTTSVTVQDCGTLIGTKDDEGNWIAPKGSVYGGGNAANIVGSEAKTDVTILGGDIRRVFGGGNGEVSPADVAGNATTTIHAGNIFQAFAGSNMQGNISGSTSISVDHSINTCQEYVAEVYGGGNEAAGNAGLVAIDCGAIVGDVYGGANKADINSNITLNITGGTINRVFGGNNTSGNISGSITVNVNKRDDCDLDLSYVYGAGNQAAYSPTTSGAYPEVSILKGTVKQDVFGGGLGATAIVTSNPTVNINGGFVGGNVFGGGSEAKTIGNTSVKLLSGSVNTDIYGGGALADVEGNTIVTLMEGTVSGNAYGGGLGQLAADAVGTEGEDGYVPAKEAMAATVTGDVQVKLGDMIYDGNGGYAPSGNATVNNIFGCNNYLGGPQGNVNVTITSGTITNNVYGGGNLAATSADPIVTINGGTMRNVYGGGFGEPAVITGNTTININKTTDNMSVANVFGGGSAANVAGNTSVTMTEGTVSNIYGGGEAADVVVGGTDTGKTVVSMNGGTVSQSIYGGGLGNTTNVATSTTVTATGGTVTEDVYGGSGFGKVQATNVTINNGATVTRDVFGGGFGQKADAAAGKDAYEADVLGDASVTINKGASISGNVYGGNNTNGSPKGKITVLVDGPNDTAENEATPLSLKDVFGGGKNAATTSASAPEVKIQGCETVIERVFGGGDAASATATNVEIWGGHIGKAFAGGNGEEVPAHVGYEADGKTEYTTGTGNVNLTIKGGIITDTFGGSNTEGNIRGTVNVIVDKDPAACNLDITNLYGGGNLANGKAGTLTVACTGDGKIDNVYGGANAADVDGDITLLITGGQIGNAFGGNNASGTINGSIRVVVDWTDSSCGKNSLDNVYGGGRDAAYITPDGKTGPLVELINATINNNVYGGGLGQTATITGNPEVELKGAMVGTAETIKAGTGGRIFGGGDAAPVSGNPKVTATEGSADKIFGGGKGATAVVTGSTTAILNKTNEKTLTISEIYGGGDAAEVTGNTTVDLTKGEVTNAFGGGNEATINGATAVTITDATAGNVYGGGNLAGVTQTATINMNGGNVTTGLYGGCNTSGTVTGDITVTVTDGTIGTDAEHKANVHGGGYGASTATGGNVNVTIAQAAEKNVTIFGDIYGGSALGNVNDNTDDNTIVTITAGTVNGDVYGGGLGDADNAALVNGNTTVNINGGSVTGSVFGCNNVNGTPKGSVEVTVADNANANLNKVYGGGNMANYEPTTAQAPIVTVNGCGNTIGYVYGGGNAADVPATNVTVWGGTIGYVFGGGHGNKDASPATEANVTGDATVNIKGGTITNVFAGSNSKGTISGDASLTINKEGECEMHITDAYGGGNQAAGNAGTVTVGCTGGETEGIQNVYGGAREADVSSDITLNITGGNISNVFGGNNVSGTINGAITVNVDWATGSGTCGTNSLGNVYGGGNLAPYTTPDGKYGPTVNILNGTVNQNVYGGGLGATAVVTGNPIVTIGDTEHPEYVATVEGDVYGGGDAAAVAGTPQVRIPAKDNTSIANVYGGGNAADVSGTDVQIDGGTITGMVFGGGHGDKDKTDNEKNPTPVAANVNGNVQLYVTGGTINKVFAGSNSMGNISGTVDFQIAKGNNSNEMHINEVYGGGNLAAGNAGTILIGCTGGDTEGIGDVYGGANAADINSDITLTITGGRINNVFGGNNTSGDINGDIEVNVEWDGSCDNSRIGNVYGGGNLATYGTEEKPRSPVVNIKNGIISQNVYGGGKGDPADHTKGQITGTPIVNIGAVKTGLGDGETDTWIAHVVGDVYGGGDAGNIVGVPQVNIINKCTTIIDADVYGGGNAADVNGTDVNIDGGNITGMVFGGGHGDKDAVDGKGNPAPTAANVGGDVNVDITGGTISKVFGGSNSMGDITGTINLNINKVDGHCDMKITEVYGGGNLAAGNAGTITIGCTGDFENNGEGIGDVYGGANEADIKNAIELTINGGHINRVFGGNNASGNITGPITVNVDWNDELTCGKYLGNVFGGGNLAGYQAATTVNLKKGTVNNIYGGGNEAGVGSATVNMSGGNVLQGLYGGCNTSGTVTGDIALTVTNGNIGTDVEHKANVHGGGYGASTATGGNVTVNIAQATEKNVTIYGDIYGGSALGNVNDNTNDSTLVTITDGTINGNVYGGGLGDADNAAQVNGGVAVSIDGGTVNGNVYGCNNTNGTPSGTVTVDVTGGTISNNVFGGGNLANATVNPVVTITGGTVTHDVYGGGALADITGNTTVNLFGGAVGGAYGGGLGAKIGVNGATADVAAIVSGNTTVTLGKLQDDGTYTASQVTETGIFGANNINGTPQGHAFVHVIKTTPRDGQQYDVPAVYGGGNLSAYDPTAPNDFAEVLIENCDNSIEYVYGGGNAAPVPATKVKIYGANAINHAFAGGNGLGLDEGGNKVTNPESPYYNPGADVGYKDYYSIKKGSATTYGTGTASIAVYGGTVHNVYGGSNTLGYIRTNSSVNIMEPEDDDPYNKGCTLDVGNVFGGGNEAPMNGDIEITLECSEGADVLYAGANNADVNGNITLNINSGTFRQVFGGNNMGGAVRGSLLVKVDETGCTPIIIKELFGCGNEAAYSVYGYEEEDGQTKLDANGHVVCNTGGDKLYDDPIINIYSATAIGTIYGGGLGEEAKVYGSPTVNVDMKNGYFADKSLSNSNYTKPIRVIKDGNIAQVESLTIPDGIGTIGTIFGGGKMAEVFGDAAVHICKEYPERSAKIAAVPEMFISYGMVEKVGGISTTLIDYQHASTLSSGIAFDGTGGTAELVNNVKIDNNNTTVSSIKIKNGFGSKDKTQLVLTTDGGFKVGDRITVSGFVNTNEDKGNRIEICDDHGNVRYTDRVINSYNTEGVPTPQTFRLEQDTEHLYVRRGSMQGVNDTNLYIYTLSVIRPEFEPEDVTTGTIFGGGKLADVWGDTDVHVRNGNVEGDIFGGGQGEAGEDKALVHGKTNVTIGE